MSSISRHFFSYSAELTFWRSKVYNQKAQQSVVICNNLLFAYSPYRTTTLSTHANFLCYLYGLNKHIKKKPFSGSIPMLFYMWVNHYPIIIFIMTFFLADDQGHVGPCHHIKLSTLMYLLWLNFTTQTKNTLFLSFLFFTYFLIESALESAPFRVFFLHLSITFFYCFRVNQLVSFAHV